MELVKSLKFDHILTIFWPEILTFFHIERYWSQLLHCFSSIWYHCCTKLSFFLDKNHVAMMVRHYQNCVIFLAFFGHPKLKWLNLMQKSNWKGLDAENPCMIAWINHSNKKKLDFIHLKFDENVPLLRHCAPPPSFGQLVHLFRPS